MAQTTRAVLLVIATRTTLVGLRASKACTQPDRSSLRALVQRRTARAPWTSNRLRYLSPRFDMRPSRFLPPLEFCLGTRPSQAASCRPDWNCDATPIVATSAVAVINPIPGIVSSRQLASFVRCQAFSFFSRAPMRTSTARICSTRSKSVSHSRSGQIRNALVLTIFNNLYQLADVAGTD